MLYCAYTRRIACNPQNRHKNSEVQKDEQIQMFEKCCIVVLVIATLLSVTACGKAKDPLTAGQFKQEMMEYGKDSGKHFRSFFVREEKKSKGLYCEEKQDMLYYRGKRRSCLGKIAAAVSSQVKIF